MQQWVPTEFIIIILQHYRTKSFEQRLALSLFNYIVFLFSIRLFSIPIKLLWKLCKSKINHGPNIYIYISVIYTYHGRNHHKWFVILSSYTWRWFDMQQNGEKSHFDRIVCIQRITSECLQWILAVAKWLARQFPNRIIESLARAHIYCVNF